MSQTTADTTSRRNSATRLLYAMLLGILLGALVGGALPPVGQAVALLGQLFLNALLLVAVPLVMASMILGVASLGDVRKLGRLAGTTLLYFLGTTALAVVLGLTLVSTLQPGGQGSRALARVAAPPLAASDPGLPAGAPRSVSELLADIATRLIPDNLFEAMVAGDILPLIVFSLAFGAVLSTLGDRGRVVIRFTEGLHAAMMVIVHGLMRVAPVGVGALIAGRLGEAGGFGGVAPQLTALGTYTATVVVALLLHGALVLPLALKWLGRRPVWAYARKMGPALATAFSTASSAATLPMTLEGVVEENRVSEQTANFVVPLGATLNMNGTALYEAVAAVFIAQVYGIVLDPGHLLVVFLTATLAAVGAAGIPEAGLVTLVLVLEAVGLPLDGIALLLIVDWFLDRCRTAVNVWGDAVGAAVVDRLTKGDPRAAADPGEVSLSA